MNDTPHRLKIAFTLDGLGVNLWSNDRTLYFSLSMWHELLHMADMMEHANAQVMANFDEPIPTRSPPTLEDLA